MLSLIALMVNSDFLFMAGTSVIFYKFIKVGKLCSASGPEKLFAQKRFEGIILTLVNATISLEGRLMARSVGARTKSSWINEWMLKAQNRGDNCT